MIVEPGRAGVLPLAEQHDKGVTSASLPLTSSQASSLQRDGHDHDRTTDTDHGYRQVERLMSVLTGDEKHSAAATSTLDVLWVLYDRVLAVDPAAPDDPRRDRFYLSKGHGPMAYYAVLAAKGFLDEALLPDWGSFDSPLGYHPDRTLLPGVEISAGSLGHGLPLAVGTALGLRAQRIGARVVVLVGDAELDEGSNHEALELARRPGAVRAHRRRRSTTTPPATPSAAGSSSASAPRAGTRSPWTGATTARWRPP